MQSRRTGAALMSSTMIFESDQNLQFNRLAKWKRTMVIDAQGTCSGVLRAKQPPSTAEKPPSTVAPISAEVRRTPRPPVAAKRRVGSSISARWPNDCPDISTPRACPGIHPNQPFGRPPSAQNRPTSQCGQPNRHTQPSCRRAQSAGHERDLSSCSPGASQSTDRFAPSTSCSASPLRSQDRARGSASSIRSAPATTSKVGLGAGSPLQTISLPSSNGRNEWPSALCATGSGARS